MKRILISILLVLISSSAFAAIDSAAVTSEDAPILEAKTPVAPTVVEKEIPLNLDKPQATQNAADSGSKMIIGMMMILILGAGAFVLAKRHSIPKQSKNQMAIKVLNQHFLGPKKSLAIIRVAGESILIGVTDNNINLIKSLSLLDEELPEVASNSPFEQVINKISGHSAGATAGQEEDFVMGGIKDVVTKKLQSMRSI